MLATIRRKKEPVTLVTMHLAATLPPGVAYLGAEPVDMPALTVGDVLTRAADLLEEFGWCQGFNALNSAGLSVDPWDREAVRFCALGAIQRACLDLFGPGVDQDDAIHLDGIKRSIIDVAQTRCAQLRCTHVPEFNDMPERTSQEMVAFLRDTANEIASSGAAV